MAECKVLKLSHHRAQYHQLHQPQSRKLVNTNWSYRLPHIIITNNNNIHRASENVIRQIATIILIVIVIIIVTHHNPPLDQIHYTTIAAVTTHWNNQMEPLAVSLVVVYLVMSLVVINHHIMECQQLAYVRQLHLWISSQHRKAHLAEHKFDDRILTTEYYEPTAMQQHSTSSMGEGGSSIVINNNKMNDNTGDMKQETTSTIQHGRYTSTSSHGSSDDHSPGYERTNFYDRVSTSQSGNRNSETSTTDFIRRNSYHSNDIRGRQRDRHFRNSPYSLIVDRSNQISHHRLTSNTWYETSPSSSSSRSHYSQTNLSNSNNTVFQQPDSSYDRHSDLSDHQTSSPSAVTTSNSNNNLKDSKLLSTQTQALISNTESPYKSKLLVNNHHHHHKSIKSRSGSESPISNRSSRSHSRSPSSCSSTHSSSPTSSRDSNSSPISISANTGDLITHNTPSSHHHSHHRHIKNSSSKSLSGSSHHSQRHRRNLQASLSNVPLQSSIDKPASSTSSLSSSGSLSGSNSLGFYSEDNRPLAICVKNLPLRSSDTSLKDGLFHEYKKHGKVTWVKVVGQNHDRYALVCFKKPEDVDKALEVSQDKLFFGCKIEVQPYQGYDVDDNEFRPYEAELDEYQPKSTRTLFIGNLEKDITVAELRKHFECFGEILEIDIKKQGSSPYAFCQYADIVSVVKAVRKMDGEHLGSTRIKLGFGKSMPTTCVWFDGIADSVTDHYLSQQCSRYGTVQKVTIDRERRMALVTFDQIQSAQQAVKEMRGIPMRGRKLQVDFASRECIDAFYARLEKHGTTTNSSNNYEMSTTPGTNCNNRYLTNLSRSRASSFSRPGNPMSGTASPTSTPSAGSTPRHLSSGSVPRKFRYATGSPEFYDSTEYLDTYTNYDHDRGVDSDHMATNDGEATSLSRRRCDKSPVERPRGDSEGPGIIPSVMRRRCERSPGEMRILESQRYKILHQLEKCPSSGDEAESPKKRAKYSQEIEDHHHNNHHDSSTTNCNGKVLDHREHSSHNSTYNHHRHYHNELAHRKTVEIRRLSDCNIKHTASVPGGAMTSNFTKTGRRPSTDSLSRYSNTQVENYQLHKRRKTSAGASTSSSSSSMTANEMEIKSRIHPIQSFETSGGESEHGSRPDTPLFDEKPDNAPTDPRQNRPRIPREPLNLPLPKFAQGFHQQLRQTNQLLPSSHAIMNVEKYENSTLTSAFAHHSSLKHKSISPSPQHHTERLRSNSIIPPISSGSSISETLLTSPRPPSLTSNSSDSEQELSTIGVGGLSTSPSLEERLKKLTEDYDSWSSNGRSSSSSHYMNNLKHSLVPEISIPETPELLRNVLKNSMFDEDMKRLENINTQAPTSTSISVKNNFGSFNSNHLSLAGTSPLMSMSPISSISTVSAAVMHSESLLSGATLGKLNMPPQQPVITTVVQHRLGSSSTGSPMNSPNTASPYNSPNPSSASSISSLKGLQYPFPSHTTTTTCSSTVPNNSPASIVSSCTTSTIVSSVTSIIPSVTSVVTTTASVCSQQKPKTCTLSKSVSLQESTSATTGTNNNHSNNNFNASFNKSSTNNLNNNSSNDNPTTSKQLVKSISLPSCGSSAVETENNTKIEEKKIDVHDTGVKISNDDIKKEHEIVDKKNHVKDRRKNSEHDEIHAVKDEVKEHIKKEKEPCRQKEKEGKKNREKECVEEKKIKSEAATQKTISKKTKADDSCSEDKKEEIFERAPSPGLLQRKTRRISSDDMSGVDSSVETVNHLENNKLQDKKDGKHHEANKNNSKHHHHVHKERKNSIKDKLHNNDEELHAKTAKQNDLNSSKDSIFDELKRNTKDNIIKTNDKVHKNKKHHHHHRDNGNKDKENQTHQVHHYNDISSAIITDDIINRSSEDDNISLKHNHNGKKQDFSEHEHEITANHKKHDDHHAKSTDENHGKKKYQRRNLNTSISTDDSEDSDGNNKNKTSFFDILDDGPNISMYDKVKARSCKNLKKQEEEKKIKDKFTALKQSRAKREKKRLNTSEDDSDSDIHDTNSNDMYPSKFKKSHLSATDDEMRESDDEVLAKKNHKNRNLNICDDESSESGINIHDGLKKKNKFYNRKNSRNVIDSSEEEMPSVMNSSIEIKEEPIDSFDELKKQDQDVVKNYNKHSSKKRHHDKANKEDKANKKSKKISKEHHRKSTSSTDSMQKREDDIFGSISDEDHPISSIMNHEIKNDLQVVLTDIKKEKIDELIGSDTAEILTPKERQREESKRRKEKRERRREREKQRIIKEEENSVDLDEAGRALEAQLMSDSDHKINNNEITKELKTEDVFHFTDDDIKHHDSSKKKKKKKRTKEERKHHHNHHHYDTIKQEPIDANMETASPFNNNNNNNTKIKLDAVCEDVIKPSVPSLIIEEESKVETKSPQLLSPVSQIKKESKPKPEMTIPGFGGVPIDETVHEKAVLSIAAELEKKPIVIKDEVPSIPSETSTSIHEKKPSKADSEKPEEKSRVIISQEETEDAVAALLGESFSMTHEDYNDPYDVPIVSADNDIPEINEDLAMIPPEEDEEMKKAIMSLNSEIDRKIDTPQSEHDLQIDTDTEDPVEDENLSNPQLSFDEPPKTPDVEVCQNEKEKLEISDSSEKSMKIDEDATKEVSQLNEALKSIKEPEKEIVPKPTENVVEDVKKEEKIEEKPEKAAKVSHRYEPPSITIPTEQQLSSISDNKTSPRKHQSSPTKINPLYSPITPATGKDPQINIFSMNTPNTPKLSPSIISPTQTGPKIIAIPNKAENKTILIHTSNVQTPAVVQQHPQQSNNIPKIPIVTPPIIETKEPAVQPQPIQIIPKFTQVTAPEKKIETKPVTVMQKQVPPANAIRQPQIIYPPTSINSVHHVQIKNVQPDIPVELKEKSNQWQHESNSVIHKVEDNNKHVDEVPVNQEKIVEKTVEKKEVLSEASHDDDETEGSSLDNSLEKENPNFKKNRGGGKQRGRKSTIAQSPPQVQQPIQEEVPSSPQTRRGGKTATAAKRGRGGKTANTKNIVFNPQQSMPLSPPTSGARQQKISESDVYEFHDDSGEELTKSGDQRPRLVMTIKSTASTTSTAAQPVTTQSTIIQSTASITPIVSTVTTSIPAVSNNPVPQTAVIEPVQELIPPSPSQPQISSPAHQSDEFVQPGNTRKSKRLLEKDGPRTSVDDTIDDVIRNSIPGIISNMANARTNRVTRQNPVPQVNVVQTNIPVNSQPVQQPTVPLSIETKKQTRTNKKQKDRKASETSESETEKKDEKPNVVVTTIQQPVQPVEMEVKPIIAKAPIQPEPPKIIQLPTPISVTKPHQEMLPPKKEGTELLQLIDPVTGELQKMTQSKEGQYVPVSDNRTAISQQPPTQTVVVTQSAPIIVSQPAPASVQPVYHIEQTKLQHQNHPVQQQSHPLPQNHSIQQNNPMQQQQQQSHSVLQQTQNHHLQQQQQQQDEKKILPPTMPHNVIKVSSPVVIEPPKSSIITEPTHVIKPVITQNPQATACKPLKNYIYNTQPIAKPPVSVVNTSIPNTPTTVISSQNIVKMNVPSGNVQQPPTIYNLGNIIPPNVSSTKYVAQPPTQVQQQQKTIVMQPHSQTTIIHSVPPHTTVSSLPQPQAKPQIIHQKIPSSTSQPQIVIHPQTHQMPLITGQQHGAGNLMINIPNSTQSGSPSIPSPSRMTVKQVIQRTVTQIPQQQIPPQNIPSSATVVVKTTQQPSPQTHTVISSQEGPKGSQPVTRTTYIPPGTKIIDAPVGYSGNREVIFVEGKHKMFPNYQQTKYAAHQQPTQAKPTQQIVQQIPSQQIQQGPMPQQSQQQTKIIEKVPGQPQVSVQHIPMPISHQQKVYITNSGQVISNIPITSQPHEVVSNDRQQWVAHEKAPPQPLKRYLSNVMEYEEHQRVQQQHQSQQQPSQMAQASPIPRKQTYVIETPSGHPPQPVHHAPTIVNHASKTIIGLTQPPQILTGAVASPPLKAHIGSQQPIVTGASSSRIAIPTVSPKDQHIPPRHYPPEAFEDSVMRPPYLMTKLYPQPPMYMRGSEYGRIPIPRIGIAGTTEQRELPEIEEPRAASPPLELRRTTSMPLQSPSDRITDSPMMAPLYLSPRIPQPYFYEGEAIKPLPNTEPPPAHRTHPTSTTVYATQQPTIQPNLTHVQRDREREHRDKDEAVKIVYSPQVPPTQSLVAPVTNQRPIQLATPPIASQVPPHADTLSRLLERYPLMWQGLLALKTEQAAVQMHFVHGNKKIAKASLPINADHTTPPLRIAQRMRLEPSQIDGVARKMTIEDEHCVLLALPCGFDYSDVLRQTENLQVSFINYLQLKQAAGIINIADPGSQNASYVVHIFPSCDFANDSLQRIAPDLMFKVANIAYLLIVIATV